MKKNTERKTSQRIPMSDRSKVTLLQTSSKNNYFKDIPQNQLCQQIPYIFDRVHFV